MLSEKSRMGYSGVHGVSNVRPFLVVKICKSSPRFFSVEIIGKFVRTALFFSGEKKGKFAASY